MARKLDPEFKQRWLKALRSGRYKQDVGALRSMSSDGGYGYCCLGVACNLISSRKWNRKSGLDTDYDWGEFDARQTFGFPFLDDPSASVLVDMNDNGSSFSQIADWIEANL